jgi:RNA 3'-terminal phosphate cyclase (ATP)
MWERRSDLKQIKGIAVASRLPAHIAQRMRDRAVNLLRQKDLPATIEPQRVRSVSPGAGIFLVAEYEDSQAGFGAIGRKGKPAERVAEEAVNDLLAFHQSGAVLDQHLADQLILPMALSGWSGALLTERLSKHTLTNIWVVEQFLGPMAKVEQKSNLIRFV